MGHQIHPGPTKKTVAIKTKKGAAVSDQGGIQLDNLKNQASKLVRKGKFSQALHLYEEVLRRTQHDLAALLGSAECLLHNGKVPQSVDFSRRAVQVYAATGHFFEATLLTKRILEIAPEHSAAPKHLAELYSKKTGRAAQLLPRPPEKASKRNRTVNRNKFEHLRPIPLPTVPFFSELSKNAFIKLVRALEVRNVQPGDLVIRQGELNRDLFVLVNGKVEAVHTTENRKPKTIATLSEGAFWGEMALVTDLRSMATVTALEKLSLLTIPRKAINEIGAEFPSVHNIVHKLYRTRLLNSLMASSPIFAPLENEAKRQLTEKFKLKRLAPRMKIFTEGDIQDGLYLVVDGRLESSIRESGKRRVIETLYAGEVFGGRALIQRTAANKTIKTTRKTALFKLSRRSFTEVASIFPKVLAHVQSLAAIPAQTQAPGPDLASAETRLVLY